MSLLLDNKTKIMASLYDPPEALYGPDFFDANEEIVDGYLVGEVTIQAESTFGSYSCPMFLSVLKYLQFISLTEDAKIAQLLDYGLDIYNDNPAAKGLNIPKNEG